MYTVEDIGRIVSKTAVHYGVKKISLFGSYVRGEANENSDIDLHIDKGDLKGLFQLCRFKAALEDTFNVSVDVVETDGLNNDILERISKEEIVLYERQG